MIFDDGLPGRLRSVAGAVFKNLGNVTRSAEPIAAPVGAIACFVFIVVMLLGIYSDVDTVVNWGGLACALLTVPILFHQALIFRFPTYYPIYWTAWLTIGGTFVLLLGLVNYPDPTMLIAVTFMVMMLIFLTEDWVASTLIWITATAMSLAGYYSLVPEPMAPLEACRVVLVYFGYILLGAVMTKKRKGAPGSDNQPDPTLFSMAHELRTPLQSISSTVVGMRKVLPKVVAGYEAAVSAGLDVPRVRRDRLQRINDAADDIAQVVRDGSATLNMLLELSRDHLEKDSLSVVNAANAVQAAINSCPSTAMQNDVKVKFKTITNFHFMASEPLIKSVLHNLIKNGAQHAVKGGKTVDLVIEQSGSFGIIRVLDSGHGIPRHIRPYIFDPYFTSQPAGLGSGLGLAFVRKVIDAHNGRIEVRNREEGGAEFMLVFPALKPGTF